jgi:hypothetical protein
MKEHDKIKANMIHIEEVLRPTLGCRGVYMQLNLYTVIVYVQDPVLKITLCSTASCLPRIVQLQVQCHQLPI